MAAAIKSVFVDLLIIVVSIPASIPAPILARILAPILASSGNRFERIDKAPHPLFEQITNTVRPSIIRRCRPASAFSRDFVISRLALRDYLRVSV
jgi:hypothetical protein